ncbi:DsbE family thiol:disulfide interchange protein [Parvularcula sp. LCG005]|uniref:DsbE family thiol:disulfide interchange protein n=1 Tax=Parvularcula sp. LCG005 TaxID=3078805 RepID=UPI0029428293|nr:DsbE family thiol:disulfide interchange protein [Parvularcula sp. LCG005]WOI52731.1 DsbE family thiol:disulfide interchange protein [Parvularcula sp. LCG005]
MNRYLLLLPLAVFVVIGFFAVRGLTLDQSTQPSTLIDRAAPEFALLPLPGLGAGLSSDDLTGQISLVNVFGSWCVMCHVEHPFLMELQAQGDIEIYGINWMDTPERGAAWLAEHGNPYDKVGNDETSRTVVNFGVTGAPETFLVDQTGIIRFRHQGPLTREVWERSVRPLIAELRAK